MIKENPPLVLRELCCNRVIVLFQAGVGRSGNEAKLCSEAAHEGLQHTNGSKGEGD